MKNSDEEVVEDNTTNWQAQIPVELKEAIDKLRKAWDIPQQAVVKRCARFVAGMTANELKMFVYGNSDATLCEYVRQQVREYLQSDEGHQMLVAISQEVGAERSSPTSRHTRR